MRWPVKGKIDIRRKFALFPTQVHDVWIWLEFYYEYSELTYDGWDAYARFLTYEGAQEWLKIYRSLT